MNISAIWIRRPVMTILIMITLLSFGVISYWKLPVNDLPDVDYPAIQISASLPGANPETMASSVALPLEKQLSTISGVDSMTSISYTGTTTISMTFSLDRDIDGAANDVSAAISAATKRLPTNMPSPPTYTKTNPANQPVMYYVVSSKTMKMPEIEDYVQSQLIPAVSAVNGVSQALIFGQAQYAVRLRMDPDKMAVRGVGINEVSNAIINGNVNLPGGTLNGPDVTYNIDSSGQLMNAKEYNSLIVAYHNGNPIRLRDIGKATDSSENEKIVKNVITPGEEAPGVLVAIFKQPGSNAVQIASDVRKKMETVKKSLPQSLTVSLLYDKANFIHASVDDVEATLALTVLLVICVVFLFLGSLRATLIPGITVPLSLMATFAIMKISGFSLNTISLMALSLAAGFVVDDAVVVMENIVRRVEKGETPMAAAFSGSREICFTILSMTISLVVVFVPILFMSGIIGRLFREFAVSIAAAILFSGFISLTLTPMMCAYIIKPKNGDSKPSRIMEISERVFERARNFYGQTLTITLNHPLRVLVFILGVFVLAGFLYTKIDKGFIPSQDMDMFTIRTQADDRSSFDYLKNHQEEINKILEKLPGLRGAVSTVGSPTYNTGFIIVSLEDRKNRAESVDQIINRLRPEFNNVPGLRVTSYNPPPISMGSRQSYGVGQYTITSPNLDLLYKAANDMETQIKTIPGITDVVSSLQTKVPTMYLTIDRDKASALGLSANQIQDALYSAYGDRQVSTIYSASNEYDVFLDLGVNFQTDPSVLNKLYVKTGSSLGPSVTTPALVPLSTIGKLTQTMMPLSINHSGQMPSATIQFNLKPGYALGTAAAEIQTLAQKTLPSSVVGFFEGNASAYQSSFKNMGFLLLITVFLIYVVLGILYESFIHPITILTALPLAGAGALIFLMLFHMELDIYSYVGIIMLIGLVKKNGIMMVDFALELAEKQGLPSKEAIHQACLIRFRPIMMTTMAAVFGALPIALGYGSGGEARQPMGIAVVGGLVFSQFLTLYVTPVFYVWFDHLQQKLKARRQETERYVPPRRRQMFE
ncbi:acriflavin resistance protein [Lucifera butyrica]|uniref:Acriflavin resistance protein n=1 Tax=Lucifera butyrica TaxID=1351585 RepID=A0A498RF11_9FIRM|nr:efflux RND transporter permease subunit [Lucifera butyrica]VBB07768.1 acriflavin resistance protein [Lucifera butyrica]